MSPPVEARTLEPTRAAQALSRSLSCSQLTRAKTPQPGDEEEAEEEEEGGDRFALDEVLEVLEGPFKGMQGPVVSLADKEVTLALSVMGRETPVSLPRTHCTRPEDAV